jgi:D-inositol-3-phosphate glycosyltransferase
MRRVAMLSVHTCPLAVLGGRETGGRNVYVREVARHLGRLGVAVDVFTRSQTPAVDRVVALGPGARVVHVEAGPEAPMSPRAALAHLETFIDGVMRFSRRTGAEYGIVHGHYWLSGLAAVDLARRWGGRPVVQMFHTLGVVRNAVAGDAVDHVPPERIDAEARVARLADCVVAATPLERDDLAWYCGAAADRVRVIPCGVDVAMFRPGDRAAARARLGLDGDRVLLFVGRPAAIKGLEVLLRALAELRTGAPAASRAVPGGARLREAGARRRERVRLVGVRGRGVGGGGPGDGRDDDPSAQLRRLAGALGVIDWVDFRGPQPQHALPDYYRAADLCLVPSHHESFGMAALEAMACGAPVVASRVGGLATLIQDGLTGVLVPGGDSAALAATIAALLADESRRRGLGRRAAQWAHAFAWPSVVRAIADLYGELAPAVKLAAGARQTRPGAALAR